MAQLIEVLCADCNTSFDGRQNEDDSWEVWDPLLMEWTDECPYCGSSELSPDEEDSW